MNAEPLKRSRRLGSAAPTRSLEDQAWAVRQAQRQGELRLRSRSTAAAAHRACLVIGVIMTTIGFANAFGLLSGNPFASFAYISSGLGLLRWVAAGKGSPAHW